MNSGQEEGDCFLCSQSDDSSISTTFVSTSHERKTRTVEMAFGLGGLAVIIFSIVVVLFVICFVFAKKKEVMVRRSRQGPSRAVETNRVSNNFVTCRDNISYKGI